MLVFACVFGFAAAAVVVVVVTVWQRELREELTKREEGFDTDLAANTAAAEGGSASVNGGANAAAPSGGSQANQ